MMFQYETLYLVGGLEYVFVNPYVGNVIIPTDFYIFQMGGLTTNQIIWYIHFYIQSYMYIIYYYIILYGYIQSGAPVDVAFFTSAGGYPGNPCGSPWITRPRRFGTQPTSTPKRSIWGWKGRFITRTVVKTSIKWCVSLFIIVYDRK